MAQQWVKRLMPNYSLNRTARRRRLRAVRSRPVSLVRSTTNYLVGAPYREATQQMEAAIIIRRVPLVGLTQHKDRTTLAEESL